ncbi:MAG: TlpA family protein disulfide reductase [Bacteroidales bacterium]
MKKNLKAGLIIVLISIATELAITPFRMFTGSWHGLSALAGFLFYFLLMNFVAKSSKNPFTLTVSLLLVLLGCFAVQLPIRIYSFSDTLISLPDFLFHLLGIIVGALFYKLKSTARWVLLIMSLIFASLFVYKGFEMWVHHLNFGNFTGKIEKQIVPRNICFEDSLHHKISLSDLRGKVVVLDFWFSKCGVCFQEFPNFQRVYDTYKSNPNVYIASVNFFQVFDSEEEIYRLISQPGYTFPVLICNEKKWIDELGIKAYPTIIIIDQQGNMVFRGSNQMVELYLENLLSNLNSK